MTCTLLLPPTQAVAPTPTPDAPELDTPELAEALAALLAAVLADAEDCCNTCIKLSSTFVFGEGLGVSAFAFELKLAIALPTAAAAAAT